MTALYTFSLIAGVVTACDILPRPGDTQECSGRENGISTAASLVDTDPRYTLVHVRVDTTGIAERHDVLLARFDFDPSDAIGDEYALTIALDLGDVRRRSANHPSSLGDSIPAYGTVTCLCRPLRPDSVRGHIHDSDAGPASACRPHRCDAVLHGVGYPKTHASLSPAPANPRGETLMAVGRLGGWAVGLLVLLAAQPPNRLTAQTDSPRPTIDSIIIDNEETCSTVTTPLRIGWPIWRPAAHPHACMGHSPAPTGEPRRPVRQRADGGE